MQKDGPTHKKVYEPMKFFTPPYETVQSLKARLEEMYADVRVGNLKSIAWFVCKKVKYAKKWRKDTMSEKITLSGVPETMLQTVYARAKETKMRGAITDNKAVEIIDRLDYDFSMADKDAAMLSGVIARTIVLDKLVKTYLAGHGGAVVVNIACGLDTRCYRMSGYAPPDGRQPRRQTVSAAYKENAGALLLRIRQHGGPLQVPRRGEKSVSRRSFPCF